MSEFLFEAPDAFSVTPGVDEGEDDEESDALSAGDGDASSVESTAGTDPNAGANFVSQTTNPGTTGITSPSEMGSGLPPTTEPLDPTDPPPPPPPPPPAPTAVLSSEQTAALLADNRFGLAVGAQGATVDANGNLQAGPTGLFGGLATFNSPLLALDSGRSGLGTGIGSAARQDLLDDADLLLLPGSGEFTLNENKGGVTGLVWGRYAAPVKVFVDAMDDTRFLELDRDLLFVIGAPTDIADLEGIFFYELSAWDAISSGLPISGIEASGALDLGSGVYTGFIDILLGANGAEDFSLLAEFSSQVNGGVLEGIVFGTLDLFEFATEATTAAEGTLAGFFTGNAAAFLQLAFDFRVPSRSDADVRGLALLAQQTEIPDGALTPAEAALLDGGMVFVAAGCCFSDGDGGPTGTFGGFTSDPAPSGGADTLLGINLVGPGEAAEPFDPEFVLFPPDVVIRRNTAPTVASQDYGDGVFGFEWQGQNGPALAYDAVTGEIIESFGQSIQIITGIPTPTANLIGSARFELQEFGGFALLANNAGFQPGPLTDVSLSFNVDFGSGAVMDGLFLANIDLDGGFSQAESSTSTLFALFDGQVALANGNPFVAFDIFSGGADIFGIFDELDLTESDLSGFFSGSNGNRFVAAYRFQTIGDNGLDDALAPLLAIGTAVLGRQDLALSAAEAALFGDGLGFVGVDCCSMPAGGMGLATAAGGDAVLGIYVQPSGEDISPLDSMFGFGPPPELIRRAGAFTNFEFENDFFSGVSDAEITEVYWFGGLSPALNVDAGTGAIIDRLDDLVLFQTAMPSTLATLEAQGFATFSGRVGAFGFGPTGTYFGFESDAGNSFLGFTSSFNVDLVNGNIFAGHLFLVDERKQVIIDTETFSEDLGFEVFFDGQVGVLNGNSFAQLRILDGAYHGLLPLDLEESELKGFFAGDDGVVFLGSYGLATAPGFGPQRTAAGIFALSNEIDPEFRLDLDDVSGWKRFDAEFNSRPGFALAVFETDAFGDEPTGGVLLGRGNDPNGGSPFVLGANRLLGFDPFSELPARTRRTGFFAQPFEYLLREGDRLDLDIDIGDPSNVTPGLAPSFQGFEVSWGAWEGNDGPAARILLNSQETGFDQNVGRVFVANVNPTPILALADLTGSFLYAGGDGAPITFMGTGGGALLESSFDLDSLVVAFDLNFDTGVIADGFLSVAYGSNFETEIRWDVEFGGVLNGAITDFAIDSVSIFDDGLLIGTSGDYGLKAEMTGVLTGPLGQRHVGGFSFAADILSVGPEAVQGIWVLDQFDVQALPPGGQ